MRFSPNIDGRPRGASRRAVVDLLQGGGRLLLTFRNFLKHGAGSGRGVFGLPDRAAHHDVIGAIRDGLTGGGDPFLIAQCGT